MAQVPPSVVLVKNSFTTAPDESTATVDVYKAKNLAPVNSINDKEDSQSSSLKEMAVRSAKSLKSYLPTILSVARDGTSLLNATSTAARIQSLLKLGSTGFTSLPSDFQDKIAGLAGKDSKSFGDVFATVGGVTQRVAGTKLNDIRQTGRLLGDLSGDPKLVGVQDQDSTISVFSSVIGEASRTGIPNSFSSLAGTLNNSQAIRRLANASLPATLENSDALGLKDLATAVNPKELNLLNPNLIDDFSSNYTLPVQCTAAQAKTETSNVMNAFNAVDPTWLTKDVGNGTTATDVSKLMSSSSDMQKIFDNAWMDDYAAQNGLPNNVQPFTLAAYKTTEQYKNNVGESVIDSVKRQYPEASTMITRAELRAGVRN